MTFNKAKYQKNPAWKNNSSGKQIQYDFVPPQDWDENLIKAKQMEFLDVLRSIDTPRSEKHEQEWVRLARQLLKQLRYALILELEIGNKMTGIGKGNWPNLGSIVVNMSNRFSPRNQNVIPEVQWRRLDDPHYCREELSQRHEGIEYLIIT